MKKRMLPIFFAFIVVVASSAIAYAGPGCTPPIIPYPTDIIQPASADIELTFR